MSVNVSARSVRQWRDVTVGKFDCHCQLADLETGRVLATKPFAALGSTWFLSVKGSKEWCPGVWKFDALLRCLRKGGDDAYEFDVVVGEEKLRPVPSEVPVAFELHHFTARLADRDVRGTYAREGKVRLRLTITVTNSERFVAEHTDLKFRKEARPVDDRETGGRLEGDTGRTERPPPEGETGGLEGDTGRAQRTTPERETGGLEDGETGRTERPPPEPETSELESETGRAEQPPPERETDDDSDTWISKSTAGEFVLLFSYCTCLCHLLELCVGCWVSASLGLLFFLRLIWDLLSTGELLAYLYVLMTSNWCPFIPAYLGVRERKVLTSFLCCVLLLEWTLSVTIWRRKPKTDANEASVKS